MNAVVLYESLFGNTEAVARAIGEGLGSIGEVTVVSVDDAPEALMGEADLVVVGGPTHGRGLSTSSSRRQPNARELPAGIREWLENTSAKSGTKAAAFDTRFKKPRWLTGSAAVRIARSLNRTGLALIVPPESFFVQHTEGPLEVGEEDRARSWGSALARRVAGH